MIASLGERDPTDTQLLQEVELDVSITYAPGKLNLAVGSIDEGNVIEVLGAIANKWERGNIRYLIIAIKGEEWDRGNGFDGISWYIIAWTGMVDHIQVVNKLRARNFNGNFASVLGLGVEQQLVTYEDVKLAGYIEGGNDGVGNNQVSITFSSSSLKKAGYSINADDWRHKFVKCFPNVTVIEGD